MDSQGQSGWDEAAAAWITSQGDNGDWSRRYVLDAAMMERVKLQPFRRALDVGCGEGRFCRFHLTRQSAPRSLFISSLARMLAAQGISATGLDPTSAFLDEARRRDASGTSVYVQGVAEKLPFEDGSFDLVVSYLRLARWDNSVRTALMFRFSLIDIPDFRTALAEMHRVLSPGGTLLIANLNNFMSCTKGAIKDEHGQFLYHPVDRYADEFSQWVEWNGVRVQNWYMARAVTFDC
jgi:ubiquinone/menaquinone biosynthesis C-methylase UbiE